MLLRYFILNSKLRMAQAMQYKVDFFLGVFISLSFSCLGAVFQYLIFTQTRGYPRWNLEQIILLQGVMLFWTGIKDLLFAEVRGYVEVMVRDGNFDRLLLKPYSPIGVILASGFYHQALGTILGGLAIMAFAAIRLELAPTPWQVLLFLGFIFCGIILHMAVTVLYCVTAIMLVQMGRLGEILDKLLAFSQYPIDILPAAVRLTMYVVVPIAVWIYFPTEVLLGRLEPIAFLGMGTCFILFLVSLRLWSLGLTRYTSAGG
jgi:ABC-2 type transport system permease protein